MVRWRLLNAHNGFGNFIQFSVTNLSKIIDFFLVQIPGNWLHQKEQTKKKINEEKFLGFVLRWHRQAAGQN